MSSLWTSLNLLLPPMRTPRQRLTVAGGALLLLAGLAWALWTLLAPENVDYSRQWFSVEFSTDNQAHPVHLTLPDGKEGMFDLLMIENLSDKPLSLLAFSSRPRIPGLPPDQVMTAWAQWIATSKQGIIVQPRSSWVLNPNDLDRLPSFHGHTWISVFFSDTHPTTIDGLPATVLPPDFNGRFRVHYCRSKLREGQSANPHLHRQDLVRLLQHEIDASDKCLAALSPSDIGAAIGQLLQNCAKTADKAKKRGGPQGEASSYCPEFLSYQPQVIVASPPSGFTKWKVLVLPLGAAVLMAPVS